MTLLREGLKSQAHKIDWIEISANSNFMLTYPHLNSI